jgi:predicted DNA-binding mobile mystery protein A
MTGKSLQIRQIDAKIKEFVSLQGVVVPSSGWIKAIRKSLGMSMQQLGKKLNISKQGVFEIERREKEGAITLNSLKDVAHSMDMELVYGFVPKDGSLDALIERRAREIATQIVQRASHTMVLEGQQVYGDHAKNSIEEYTAEIKREIPGYLWD